MGKGMTGEAIRTVVILVIAVIALVLLWMFFSGQLKITAFSFEEITKGFAKTFNLCKDFKFLFLEKICGKLT